MIDGNSSIRAFLNALNARTGHFLLPLFQSNSTCQQIQWSLYITPKPHGYPHQYQPSFLHPLQSLPPQQLAAAADTFFMSGSSDLQVYTDDSTKEGTDNGGAGMVVCQDGKTIHSWKAPTGSTCSSFHLEKAAMVAAILWLHQFDN